MNLSRSKLLKTPSMVFPMKPTAFKRDVLARNLSYLMKKNEVSERTLEKLSGVSQKQINNIRNEVHTPSLDTIEKIATVFGIAGWHMIMPELPESLLESPAIENLVKSYTKASEEGREVILKLAEREGKYGGK